jgi:hypothetical protein
VGRCGIKRGRGNIMRKMREKEDVAPNDVGREMERNAKMTGRCRLRVGKMLI